MPPAPSPPPNTASMTRSIATTMARTASANSSTSRVEVRRALAWCSKKFIQETELGIPGFSELDLRRRPHLLLLLGGDLQQRGRGEVEHAGDDARGEHLALVVV